LAENVHQLGANALRNFILLLLVFVLSVFEIALQRLLLGLNRLDALILLFVTQLAFGSRKLLLKALDLIVGVLQFDLLGLELLLQSIEITLSFIGADNCTLDIDDAELRGHSHVGGSSRIRAIGCGCGCTCLAERNSGEDERQSCNGENLAYHLCGELLEK